MSKPFVPAVPADAAAAPVADSPATPHRATAPAAKVTFTAPNVLTALARPLAERWSGSLLAAPSGIKVFVQDGLIAGVEGHLTLGEIILERGLLTEPQVKDALADGGRLGRTLVQRGLMRPQQLQGILTAQAEMGLANLRATPPSGYTFEPAERLPWPHAGLNVETVAETPALDTPIPYDMLFRLAPQTRPVTVSPAAWELLRWLNGRRPLHRAAELSGLLPRQADAAARELLIRGLLEASAIAGFRLLFVKLRPTSGARQPPASIRANLFLRHLNGEQDIQTIIDRLNYPAEEAALLLTGLYRDEVIELVRGDEVMKRLLEEF